MLFQLVWSIILVSWKASAVADSRHIRIHDTVRWFIIRNRIYSTISRDSLIGFTRTIRSVGGLKPAGTYTSMTFRSYACRRKQTYHLLSVEGKYLQRNNKPESANVLKGKPNPLIWPRLANNFWRRLYPTVGQKKELRRRINWQVQMCAQTAASVHI